MDAKTSSRAVCDRRKPFGYYPLTERAAVVPGNIGIWDLPYADLVELAIRKRLQRAQVFREDAETCTRLLVEGELDMALIPATAALANADLFDILPAFAVSSWDYPFAHIHVAGGLANLTPELIVPANASQEAFIASVILQEHYGTRILTVPTDVSPGPEVNHIVVRPEPGNPGPEDLDLGREWFELTNYPMVWGLLAVRRGQGDDGLIRAASDIAALCDQQRNAPTPGVADAIKSFVSEQLRFRLDDLAVASLTELADFMFYYSGTDEPPSLNVVSLKQQTSDESDSSNGLPAV